MRFIRKRDSASFREGFLLWPKSGFLPGGEFETRWLEWARWKSWGNEYEGYTILWENE